MEAHSAASTAPELQPPVLLVASSEDGVCSSVAAELERRYTTDYDVVVARGSDQAVAWLQDAAARGVPVALLLVGARDDPERVLTEVRRLYADARRGLLVEWGGWADPDVSRTVLELMATGRIDYYVIRPWRSPDEYFHRTVTEFLLEWERATSVRPRELTVIGSRRSVRAQELRGLLSRSGVPHAYLDAGSEEARGLLAGGRDPDAGRDDVPLVLLRDGRVLRDPTDAELVRAYGVTTDLPEGPVDVAVIGGGPSGLSAAVYSASEGLSVAVLECDAVGGQAGSSSLIRNYLGFSRGISGAELAQRAYQQAWVFGARFAHTREAVGLRRDGEHLALTVAPGEELLARAVVLATGVQYRRVGVPELEALVGAGVHYGASVGEARGQTGRDVHVVGGGNSAGQAALHLARYARRVELLVRGSSLAESMSQYLVEQLDAAGVSVRLSAEVVGGGAVDGVLDHLLVRDRVSGDVERVPCGGLFVLIGAAPRTSWLPEDLLRDRWGYVLTGSDVVAEGGRRAWPEERAPGTHETSVPGVFAVGDVRRGSVKRVASAVGEGSVVIAQVHAHLARTAHA